MSIPQMWRRFRPVGGFRILPPKKAQTELWQQVRAKVHELFPGRQLRDDALSRAIQSTRDKATASDDPILWCAAMILQAPRAAIAQEQMDQHPHGYRNKQARLYELIDFNDTYVSAVLSLPESDLSAFVDEMKRAMQVFCQQLGVRCFSDEQFAAITHGLSREIAVYRGAMQEGFAVAMTSRTQDALGIDMIITDPPTGRSINIDCKTHSAFYYRLKELRHEGRMTTEQAALAEDRGYCRIVNGDETQRALIVLWRIDEQTYGAIQNFSFVTTKPLALALRTIFQDTVR